MLEELPLEKKNSQDKNSRIKAKGDTLNFQRKPQR